MHLPIAVNPQHEKLSKQTHARALDCSNPAPQFVEALRFLGQNPPHELASTPIDECWSWARQHWLSANVPAVRKIVMTGHSI
jgi:glutamyl-Q tRNA(Asp) synthetase